MTASYGGDRPNLRLALPLSMTAMESAYWAMRRVESGLTGNETIRLIASLERVALPTADLPRPEQGRSQGGSRFVSTR